MNAARTLHVEGGRALIHVEHVGAGADVDAGILGLHVADGEDAIEVHGTAGQLAVVLACPHQRVGWGLQRHRSEGGQPCLPHPRGGPSSARQGGCL